MARDDHMQKVIKEAVQETVRLVDFYMDEILDNIWPALTELQPPAQRSAFYASVNWDWVQANAPKLWQRYSKDAQDIQQQELKRRERVVNRQWNASVGAIRATGGQTLPGLG